MQFRTSAKIATLGPIGFFPVAPGTLGAAAGLFLVFLVRRLPLGPRGFAYTLGGLVAVIYALGVWAASSAEGCLATKDPAPVVIDEAAGQVIAFLFQPALGWRWLLLGFLLFRFFDVLKPFPSRRAEHLAQGWGIMTDDIIAGAYSALTMFLLGFAIR
jgi:phosphatidylglycerophosphatase A